MARLSAVGAPATPELTEESEERSLSGFVNAGAMADAAFNARERDNASPGIMLTNSAQIGVMGQNESREALQARSVAIRRAGKQAVKPRPGKLPRRSEPRSRVVTGTGQRRLGTNVLADANTYDVPSDDEPAPIRRRAATTTNFSPLKRQVQEQQSREERRRQEERDRQAALDWQLEIDRTAEEIAILEDENAAAAEVSESGVSGLQPDLDADNALDDFASEPPQQDQVPKKKRGRPSKPRHVDDEQEQASGHPRKKRGRPSNAEKAQPVQPNDVPGKKRGRPSNAQKKADLLQSAAQEVVEEPSNLGGPSGMTDELGDPISPLRPTQSTTAQKQQILRSSRPTVVRSSTMPQASDNRRQQRQTYDGQVLPQMMDGRSNAELQEWRSTQQRASVRSHALSSANGSKSRPPGVTSDNEGGLFVGHSDPEQPDIVRPEELGDMNDGDYNNQAHAADEQQPAADEPSESGESTDHEESEDDDGDDEPVDGTEMQVEPMANDRYRLYGQWHKVREVMREVARHKGSTVRIRDEEFKEILQACKDATGILRDTAAEVDADGLNQAIVQCQNAIARAKSICGNGQALADSKNTRKRGFHIFKHLLPNLARLLRAAMKAFERVNRVGVDTDQIPLDHTSRVLNLLFSVVECGKCANKSYEALSRPIKLDVHSRITIPLRELHSSLKSIYDAEFRRLENEQRDEELAREIEARDEERERQVQWRKLELHNQEKWKQMNKARLAVSLNSGNMRKQNHLRSCGMQLVQTDANGQPYLPTHLRGRRGEWSMVEIEALDKSLRRHVDTPAPLSSMVFENLFAEQCPFRRPLTDKNVLEIVIKSNELKNYYERRSDESGIPVAEWVRNIPRWMDPPRSEHDNGNSEEDAIEIE